MPTREIAKFRDDLAWLLRHVVGCLDGLTDAEINWRPPAKDDDVTARITEVLDGLDPAELDRERPTPGGSTSGREVLRTA